jgi:LPXTG-site transpeptidase (sortase) family protein
MFRYYLMILGGVIILAAAVIRAGNDLVLAVSEPVILSLPEESEAVSWPAPALEVTPDLMIDLEPIEGLSASFTATGRKASESAEKPGKAAEGALPPATASSGAGEARSMDNLPMDPALDESSRAIEGPANAMGEKPLRLSIPKIRLNAPIVPSRLARARFSGEEFLQWMAPEYFAVGWHEGSALLGLPGNTVLSGHHNDHGEVFRFLEKLKEGDLIHVYSEEREYTYVIANRLILSEKYEKPEVRIENARWIEPSADERLTLITCWPYHTNTHRLILVASPLRSNP